MKHTTYYAGSVLFVALFAGMILTLFHSHSATGTSDNTEPDDEASAFVENSLRLFEDRQIVQTGEPELLLSRDATIRELQDTGIMVMNYDPDCSTAFHIVVFHGVFNVASLSPGTIRADVKSQMEPAQYVAYIYNAESGNLAGVVSDVSGARFREILGDETLPDSDTLPSPRFGSVDREKTPPGNRATDPFIDCL